MSHVLEILRGLKDYRKINKKGAFAPNLFVSVVTNKVYFFRIEKNRSVV